MSFLSFISLCISYSLVGNKKVPWEKTKQNDSEENSYQIPELGRGGFHKQEDDVKKSQVLLPICCLNCR